MLIRPWKPWSSRRRKLRMEVGRALVTASSHLREVFRALIIQVVCLFQIMLFSLFHC